MLDAKYLTEVLYSGRELIFGAQDARDGQHGLDGTVIEAERALISLGSAVEFTHHLGQVACSWSIYIHTSPGYKHRVRGGGEWSAVE